jgi:hypothetical protein
MCLGESVNSITLSTRVNLAETVTPPRAPLKHKLLPKRPEWKYRVDYSSIIHNIGYEENLSYSVKTVFGLRRIKECRTELNDKQVLDLIQLLLYKIKQSPVSTHCYWWSSLFKSLEYLPAKFFNCNIDVTALVLLKCYELLSLNTETDQKLKNLQELLRSVPSQVIQKIDRINRPTLKQELLKGELPFSVLHQYNPYEFEKFILEC